MGAERFGQPVGELRLQAADGDVARLRGVDGVERVRDQDRRPSGARTAQWCSSASIDGQGTKPFKDIM
jgi:hypothetical protein